MPESLQRDLHSNGATPEPDANEHQAPEITFDEQFYPARPKRFRPSARRSLKRRFAERRSGGEQVTDNRDLVDWLVEHSMLADANRLASQLSGQGCDVAEPVRAPGPARGAGARVGVVHRLSAVVRHAQRGVAICRRWPTAGCGRRSGGSASTPCTPARSSRPAASTAAASRPRSTATSTASAWTSTPSSAPRSSSARCARPRPSTRARSSTTSSRATPARARTSAWPRWATPTTRASTTWSRSTRTTGTCCRRSRRAATARTWTPRPRRSSSAAATSSAACSG